MPYFATTGEPFHSAVNRPAPVAVIIMKIWNKAQPAEVPNSPKYTELTPYIAKAPIQSAPMATPHQASERQSPRKLFQLLLRRNRNTA